MVFSALVFLSILLPLTYLLHLLLPGIRAKNTVLLVSSLVFYAYGEPVYILLLLFSTIANYCFGRILGAGRSKAVLACAVVVNIGLLVVFKYAGFLASLFNQCTGASVPVPVIRLPIGISFFTFQAMSYVIDVYRGNARASRSYPRVLLYISLFPQLVAGPIVQYRDIDRELSERNVSLDGTVHGLQRFSLGLAKKVFIANSMGAVVDTLFAANALNAPVAWLGAVSYMLQIYFDFSGYSDMAIGMGEMFGFHFRENFNYPYVSFSIREFWRRWHISLSTWFREYLYIPLGGNRKGAGRAMLNRFIVFVCTGIWHGANLTFLFWGIYHGLFMTLESLLHLPEKQASMGLPGKILSRAYALLVVCVGFVFFRADTLTQGFVWVREMFAGWHFERTSIALFLQQLTPYYLTMLVLGILFSGPLLKKIRQKLPASDVIAQFASLLVLALAILALAANTYNPFIYFQF